MRNITDPEFNSIKEGMHAEIPPYFFCIVDAIGFYQQLHKIFVCFNAFEIFRYAGTWKFVKNFCAERFVSGTAAFPERGIGTERINMWQKIAGRIGDMIGHFPAFHSNMHMQSENQVAARGFLQFIYDFIVSCMIGNELAFPVAEGMCSGCANPEALVVGDL